MADKKDSQSGIELVRLSKEPSSKIFAAPQKDSVEVREFMHEEFPHFEIRSPRSKGFVIEYPPSEISNRKSWEEVLSKVLEPEIDSLHPMLRRKKIIIRFTEELYSEQHIKVGGKTDYLVKSENFDEIFLRINPRDIDGGYMNVKTAVFVLMHELVETDFWIKTKYMDKEAVEDIAKSESLLGQHEYHNLLDEKVANRRAERALKRMWNDFSFEGLFALNEYEEDKE